MEKLYTRKLDYTLLNEVVFMHRNKCLIQIVTIQYWLNNEMKILSKISKSFGLLFLKLTVIVMKTSMVILTATPTAISAEQTKEEELAHNQWLKDRYSQAHQELIPVVAIADMFFACDIEHNIDKNDHKIKYLVIKMDRNLLAEQLSKCLGEETIHSNTAINYGLHGCFHDQLADLPVTERKQKMKLVKQAIASLSREERLKSFTQCVTDQAINYLN